jgi:16S rRNA (guanine527-N7)-methyltransferase
LPDPCGNPGCCLCRLLRKWNRTYNLTAIRDEKEMLTHHLLDSLSVLPALRVGAGGTALGDVGSGAGLPGIPLAIALPDLSVTSIETVQKKAAFQRRRKSSWAGQFRVLRTVGSRTCQRAVSMPSFRAPLPSWPTSSVAGHLLAPSVAPLRHEGRVSRRGNQAPARLLDLREVLPLRFPGVNAQRHLLVIEKA